MEIKQVRYFRTVVEAGSLTKAAALLRLTPGTLSKAMRHFEDDVGSPLFRRAGRTLALTEDGERLYRLSGRLVDEHQRLLLELDASRPAPRAVIRVASFEVFTTHCLGAADLDAALQILEVRPGAIERAVSNQEVDIGVTYVPTPAAALHFERIAKIEFGIFGRRGRFRRRPFDDIPFAIPTTPMLLASADILGIDCWPSERVPRLVQYRLTSLESALALARRGACVVFMPLFLARVHNQVVRPQFQLERVPDPPRLGRVRRDVHIVTRNTERDGPPARTIATALREVIRI